MCHVIHDLAPFVEWQGKKWYSAWCIVDKIALLNFVWGRPCHLIRERGDHSMESVRGQSYGVLSPLNLSRIARVVCFLVHVFIVILLSVPYVSAVKSHCLRLNLSCYLQTVSVIFSSFFLRHQSVMLNKSKGVGCWPFEPWMSFISLTGHLTCDQFFSRKGP